MGNIQRKVLHLSFSMLLYFAANYFSCIKNSRNLHCPYFSKNVKRWMNVFYNFVFAWTLQNFHVFIFIYLFIYLQIPQRPQWVGFYTKVGEPQNVTKKQTNEIFPYREIPYETKHKGWLLKVILRSILMTCLENSNNIALTGTVGQWMSVFVNMSLQQWWMFINNMVVFDMTILFRNG